MKKLNTVLIYDSSKNTGHHLEYIISLLASPRRNNSSGCRYYFVLHPDFRDALENIQFDDHNIFIVYIDEKFIAKWSRLGMLRQSIDEWKYITSLVHMYHINKVLFLMIDRYQMAVGIYKYKLRNVSIEGIFFKPYTRYHINRSSTWQYLKGAFFCIYKRCMLAIMMSNKDVRRIWVLNDRKSSERLNKRSKSEKFEYLPDPVKQAEKVIIRSSLFEKYDVGSNAKKILVFGSISHFKNLKNIIISLSKIDNLDLSLFIFGLWTSQKYKEDVCKLVNECLNGKSNINVIIEDRYFSDNEIEAYLSEMDVVLVAYLDFFYSSGVLGRASAQGIPVIGAKNSLIGELIEKYSLGVSVDSRNPDDIAKAIQYTFSGSGGVSTDGMDRYVSERTYDQFVNLLLNDHF